MKKQLPLVYFHGIIPGKYLAVWPVYVVGDDPISLVFRIAVDDASFIEDGSEKSLVDDSVALRRAYVTSTIRTRLHQRSFRERVIAAYRSQCSLCKLRHTELLDAAHIIPDRYPESQPSISNGISLCKLHHAAFDSFIIGVSPDFKIHVRRDVLLESDGPMLRYGLQKLDGERLVLPAAKQNWPDRGALEWRFDKFRSHV
ncbi:HNH endonuclease [bacterium]|nr:HNH endonuclease [candidate division CSSED10-310 bacterium]